LRYLLFRLSDYSAATIKTYYRKFDEIFPQEGEIARRLEGIFSKLVEHPEDFSETIFKSAQVAFSLMVVIDAMREQGAPASKVRQAISESCGVFDTRKISSRPSRLSPESKIGRPILLCHWRHRHGAGFRRCRPSRPAAA
jgi:hypothetical protein